MGKKLFITITIIIMIIIMYIFFTNYINRQNIDKNTNIVEKQIEISSKYVSDDCINEWSDYSAIIQEEVKETNKNISEENRHYILKSKDSLVYVYYINEKEEEVLYRVTDISTRYLAEEDIKELEVGINVYGGEELNKLLEDFE